MISLLLCGVQHEVQLIHVVPQIVVKWWHLHGASSMITPGVMLEAQPPDLLDVMATEACEHLLHAPGQAINPIVLHNLELDKCGGAVSHLTADTGHDKPLKFPFRMIIEPTSHELWEWATKVDSKGGEILFKDKIPIMP
jgi:hypothetical protein